MPEPFRSAGGRGPRPPWWPEGEPFPPHPRTGPGRWPPGGRRFLRRVAIAFAIFFTFSFAFSWLAGSWFWRGGDGPGPGHWRGPGFPLPLLALGLLVVAFVAGRSVRRMAAPIGDVMEAADRVAGGDLGARVEPSGPTDVRRLGRSFNQMAERLEANEARRRALLADVAHELRTPLSVIRGNVEGMLDGLYPADDAHLGPVLEEAAVMARLLDDLQTLSTAEAGVLRLYRERLDPAGLVQDVTAAFQPRADEAGIRLDWRAEPGTGELDADPVRLGQVLSNLLANALRHTPRGGSVTVTVGPDRRGVAFAVADTGSGIAAGDLERVFGRFVKSADSDGAGLGLAIARSLVEAHGGSISASSSEGSGTTMRFVLPGGGGA
jgi:signal transduction histidine kinase